MRRRGVWWEAMLVEKGCVLADGELDDRRVAGRAPSTRGRLPALLCHSPRRHTRLSVRVGTLCSRPPPRGLPAPTFCQNKEEKRMGVATPPLPAGTEEGRRADERGAEGARCMPCPARSRGSICCPRTFRVRRGRRHCQGRRRCSHGRGGTEGLVPTTPPSLAYFCASAKEGEANEKKL